MKTLSLFAALFLGLVAARAIAADEFTIEPGFISLFNGKDLSGWGFKGAPPLDGKSESADGRYSANAGIFAVNPPKGVVSKIEQSNFTANRPGSDYLNRKLQWKILSGSCVKLLRSDSRRPLGKGACWRC